MRLARRKLARLASATWIWGTVVMAAALILLPGAPVHRAIIGIVIGLLPILFGGRIAGRRTVLIGLNASAGGSVTGAALVLWLVHLHGAVPGGPALAAKWSAVAGALLVAQVIEHRRFFAVSTLEDDLERSTIELRLASLDQSSAEEARAILAQGRAEWIRELDRTLRTRTFVVTLGVGCLAFGASIIGLTYVPGASVLMGIFGVNIVASLVSLAAGITAYRGARAHGERYRADALEE